MRHAYHEFAPHPRAASIIETFWSYLAPAQGLHLVLPDGRMDIILRFRTSPAGLVDVRPSIAGPSDVSGHVPVEAGEGFLGLRLRPEAAGSLGPAARAFRAQVLRAETAFEALPGLKNLPGRAPCLPDLVRVMENWVCDHATPPDARMIRAMDHLRLSGGRAPVEALARASGVTARQLGRLFDAQVGMSPKRFADILRFHRTLRLLSSGLSLSATAMEAGYADQSHMTRSFQRHGGFSPARRPPLTLAGFALD